MICLKSSSSLVLVHSFLASVSYLFPPPYTYCISYRSLLDTLIPSIVLR